MLNVSEWIRNKKEQNAVSQDNAMEDWLAAMENSMVMSQFKSQLSVCLCAQSCFSGNSKLE